MADYVKRKIVEKLAKWVEERSRGASCCDCYRVIRILVSYWTN